jgi:hypothetical protein
MATVQLGSSQLCALAHDLVNIVQQYQHKQPGQTALQMHNTRMGEWDEIRVVTIDSATGKEKPILKISLAQLTPKERKQLQIQVGLYNKAQNGSPAAA